MFKKTAVIAGSVAGALLLLFVAVAIIVPLVVDVDQYRPQIVAAVNERIQGKLELGRLKLSLWGRIQVRIDGVKLSAASPVLSVKDAHFDVPWLSLLKGSPVITLNMNEPEIQVVSDAKGELNVMSLMRSESRVDATKPAEPAKPTSLVLPAMLVNARLGMELRNAKMRYQDAAKATDLTVRDLNLVLHDVSLSRPMAMELWAQLDSRIGDHLTLKGPVRLGGQAQVAVQNGKLDQVDTQLKLDLDQLEILLPGTFEKRRGTALHADAHFRVGARDLVVESLVGRFFNAELSASGRLSQLEEKGKPVSVVDLELKSNSIELKDWVSLMPSLKAYEPAGVMSLQFSMNGPSDQLNYQGLIRLDGVTGKHARLKARPTVNGMIRIATDQIEDLALSLKAPGTEMKLKGSVRSFAQPKILLQLTASSMDLDQWVTWPDPKVPAKTGSPQNSKVPATQDVKVVTTSATAVSPVGVTPAEEDNDAMISRLAVLPPVVAASGTLTADLKGVKMKGIPMSAVTAKLSLKNLNAQLESLQASLFGGSLQGTADVKLMPPMPTYRFSFGLSGLELSDAVANQYAAFKDTVRGQLSLKVAGNGTSLNYPKMMAMLQAKGSFRVEKAVFATVDVSKMAFEAVNHAIEGVAN